MCDWHTWHKLPCTKQMKGKVKTLSVWSRFPPHRLQCHTVLLTSNKFMVLSLHSSWLILGVFVWSRAAIRRDPWRRAFPSGSSKTPIVVRIAVFYQRNRYWEPQQRSTFPLVYMHIGLPKYNYLFFLRKYSLQVNLNYLPTQEQCPVTTIRFVLPELKSEIKISTN